MTGPDPRPSWPSAWPYAMDAEPARGARGMVATTDALATDVGVAVLEGGGNAVDAAVAVSFALAVVNPEAGNVGGGGFMVLSTGEGDVAALDFRSTAPAAATRDMFLDPGGRLTEASEIGALAAAVPGSVMGCWEAHARFGRTPWRELVQPAVELAEGFVVAERLTRSFPPHIVEGLRRFAGSSRIFLPGGEPPRLGSILRQPDLARTLARVRDEGPDGFYRGETARGIVAEMEGGGGVMTLEDLAGYRALWREPVRISYRGHVLVSMPPPSSGGVTLAAMAGMLADLDLGAMAWHGADHVHLLAEVWRRAFADRNHYLADPDRVDSPVDVLTSAAYAAWRRSDIDPRAATPSTRVDPGVDAYRAGGGPRQAAPGGGGADSPHTTHVSIVDPDGGAVAFTTTVNTWYGSKVVARGTGVLLNNDMDDFSAKPGSPNHFGLVQGEANVVAPGKRPLSAMTPTLVLDADGRLRMVVGTPGGSTIITTVFQVVSNVLDHGMGLAPAVLAPRVDHQHLPDQIWYEPGGLEPGVVKELEARGHSTRVRDEPSGDVQAIVVRTDGTLEGVADPRRGGSARGF